MASDADRSALPPESELGELVELERRIEAELREARADAERILAAAGAQAQDHLARGESACEAELAALRKRLLREADETIRDIEVGAEAEAAGFEGVGEAEIEALGRFVVDRLGRDGRRG